MNRSLETSDRIRVFVVGSSEMIRAATATLEETALSVVGTVPSRSEFDPGSIDAVDCLLTDDRDVLSAVGNAVPAVYAVDPMDLDGPVLDRHLDNGMTEVLTVESGTVPSLLEHRIRTAIELDAGRTPEERDTNRTPGERDTNRDPEERDTNRGSDDRRTLPRGLLAHSSDTLLVVDDSFRIAAAVPSEEWNGPAETEELVGRRFVDMVHPEDRASVSRTLESLREGDPGSTATIEYRFQHDDGWWVHAATLTNRLDDESISGIVASIRDATAYHHVVRELDKSFDRVTDAFYALDSEWKFTYVNDRAIGDIDLDRDELLGRDILAVFPGLEGSPFESAAIEAVDTQEPKTVEAYFEPYDAWIDARIYPSPSGISVYWRDVTDRIERERKLDQRTERLEVLIENVPVALFVLDSDGTFTFAEGRAFEHLGVDTDDIVGESAFSALEDYPAVRADFRAALDGQTIHAQRRVADRMLEAWCRPISTDGDVDRVIGIAVDITDRTQYQETLSALHDATSHLLSVESKQAACEYVVDVAFDVLGLEGVIVYRFDEQHNELIPAAHSPGLEEITGVPPRLRPHDDSITWETFVSRSPAVFDDVRTSETVYNEATNVRSGLYVPFGEHGVLVAVSTAVGQFDQDTVDLAQLFATTAEATFDRIGRTQRLHDREHELERQNEHLERLNETNRIRQDIEQHLLMADSREEIERGICTRLADLEACSMAWIGTPDPSGNRLEVRESAGRDRGYLSSITVTTVDDSAAEPAGRAARTGESTYVQNVADSIHDGSWRAQALSENYQSVFAVPLVYDGFLYGVLSLYGDDPDAFDELFRSTLVDLSETIAYTIDAVKRKTALIGDEVTEIKLAIEDDSALVELSNYLDARVSLEGMTPRDDGTVAFVSVTDAVDGETVPAAVNEIGDVVDASVLGVDGEETLLQLELSTPFLGSVVTDHGGMVREFVCENREAWAVIHVPSAVDVREVISTLNRRGVGASMIARREQSRDDLVALDASSRNALLDRLTDRQREVVQTAYHSGFFEWPRRTTGEDIAISLDISSPAFHKHVRSTEKKLFEALFDEGLPPEGG
ncbi:bacterio-opsin activator domain-containing protein [Natrarchaeobius chitinivorans]|uniref:PAS domain S-box protein n=1 Tax=Natrarchaeobius chitinivorans TaxID=1679083 RepID=A0A3N6MY19_NATCH|nr:bacterio-opsin activator domain-containing protein [Natrarchaeobius chitinivorans]RQG90452.1 PAS domain S-box protein [Natrarchaeobius chitinivorans]